MSQKPITNDTPNPLYVGGRRIEPGETRLFEESALPPHLRAAPKPKPAPEPEPDPRLVLLEQSIAAFQVQICGIGDDGDYLLSVEDLEWLRQAEAEGQNRKGIAAAIDEEILQRAAAHEQLVDLLNLPLEELAAAVTDVDDDGVPTLPAEHVERLLEAEREGAAREDYIATLSSELAARADEEATAE